jgi:hypothetical protein
MPVHEAIRDAGGYCSGQMEISELPRLHEDVADIVRQRRAPDEIFCQRSRSVVR